MLTLHTCKLLMYKHTHYNRDIAATLDFVLTLWNDSAKNYPAALQQDTKDLVHWCHGATGAVFTFSTAYTVLGKLHISLLFIAYYSIFGLYDLR
jgi:Lanthionine synthetase C-like protein